MRWILALLSAPTLAYALTIPYAWDAPQTWQSGDWYEYEATVNGAVVTAGATTNTNHTLELPGVDGAMVGFRVRSCRDDDGETLCSDSCNGFPASTSPCRDGWTYLDTPHPSTPQNRAQQLSDDPEPPAMALSFSVLTSGTVTSEPEVTASISPAANSLIIVAVAAATTAGPSTPTTTVTGFSATWSATSQAYGSRRALSASTALMGASPGSGTLTLDTAASGNPFAEMKYAVIQVTGVDTGTPVGTKYAGVQAGGTSLSITVSDTPDSGDMVFAVFAVEGGSVSATLNGELDNTLQNSGGGSHVRTLVTAYDSAPDGSPAPGITWTGTESAGGIAFVVNAAAGGATASLTGQSVATALGTLTSTGQALHALSGQSMTSALGTLSATGGIAVSLSGNEIASALGALGATGAAVKALTGSALTSALGNLSATGRGQVSLSGLATTSTLGDLAATGAAAHTLSGQSITSGLGTLSASGSISVELSGLSVSSQLGTLTGTGAAAITLSGNEIASALGTVQTVNGVSITLTGMQAAVSLGDVTAATTATVTLSGLQINAALGTITGTGAATVTLSGNDITSALGTLSASSGGEGALLATVTLTPALDAALTVTAPRRTS